MKFTTSEQNSLNSVFNDLTIYFIYILSKTVLRIAAELSF